jgi:hypothetical protein
MTNTEHTPEAIIAELDRVEARRHEGRLERLIAGVAGAADDLELDELGAIAIPLVAERLRRIAGELATLSARDLLKVIAVD